MISASDPKLTAAPRPWYRPSLTTQIMIGLVVGGVIGWLRPDWEAPGLIASGTFSST